MRGFVKDGAFHHASALSFDTVLAMVPMLAIFFAALKGLGAYEDFVHRTVEPWILSTFGEGGGEQTGLREAFLHLLAFGANTELAPLGFFGLVLVLYLVLLLLNTVETVFNHIWGVRRPRSIARKVADYAAILFVTPFGLFLVTAVAGWERGIHFLGPAVHDVLVQILAVLVSSFVFAFLYLVVPHTRTKVRSAALGGLVAGAAWYGVLHLYAVTQVGVSRYNALYSSFAAIPLFLVWVFVSWLVVLFGAEIAAAHHNQVGFRWRVHHHDASPGLKRYLALRLMVSILRSYLREEPPRTLDQLAEEAGVPEQLAKDVLDVFVARGYLVSAEHAGRPAYVPARDLGQERISDVLAVVRDAPDDRTFAPEIEDPAGQRTLELLGHLDAKLVQADENLSLRELTMQEPP